MMYRTRENPMVAKARDGLTALGCKALKIQAGPHTPKGTPDLFVCVPHVITEADVGRRVGLLVVVEGKPAGAHPELVQEVQLEQWQAAGAAVGVIRSVDDALRIVEQTRAGTAPVYVPRRTATIVKVD